MHGATMKIGNRSF